MERTMTRIVTRLRDDWKFTRTRQPDALERECDESAWETVQVPHDWAIAGPFDIENDIIRRVKKGQADVEESVQLITGRTGGLPHTGEGWYRKTIEIPAESAGKTFRLECDGIMSRSTVYCNGEHVGGWPYGYTSFAMDITSQIRPGETNVIAVHVNNMQESARWYPGAGIYRNVRLVELAPIHIGHWGVCITTPTLTDELGIAHIKTTVSASGANQAVTLKTIVLDPEGKDVATTESTQDVGETSTFEQVLEIPSPRRWSLEAPSQYKAVSEVVVNGETVDRMETRFGFRTLRFDAERGFFLNDKPMKMNGVCMHHDLGPLGAAVNREALRRQLTLLKEMGCNAIRTSHNPPDPQLPELASEMGILIIDEMYDEWKYPGQENGSHKEWDEWAEKDMGALVRRDRNEPSVIMWSIGNEIPEQGKPDGGEIAQVLIDVCKEEDPTRPTTAGLNGAVGEKNTVAGRLDVPGWNYKPQLYGHAHVLYPGKAMYGSETASTISSRGEYYFPAVDEVHLKRDTLQVNSYDMSYPGWATAPDIEFAAQDACPFIMGEFVWTGFDYLGEPTPYSEEWPSRSSYFGIIDLGGLPKDRFYLYQSQWSNKPVLHLLPHWTWPGHEGKPIPVHCYTSFNRVELFLNGKSIGKKSHYYQHKVLESNYRFVWNDVPYEAGELKVVAYNRDGVAAEFAIRTAGQPKAIELVSDRSAMTPDGDDMAFVTVKVVDENGVLCPRADHSVSYEVEGPAEIVALCNGDATSVESFKGTQMKVFNGMAVVYLRSLDGGDGDITLKANAEGLSAATVKLNASRV
jgi:beta-galactosidase